MLLPKLKGHAFLVHTIHMMACLTPPPFLPVYTILHSTWCTSSAIFDVGEFTSLLKTQLAQGDLYQTMLD